MSISYLELLHGHTVLDVTTVQQHNLEDLLVKINKIRTAYGKPMTVTSGIRLEQDQLRIYRSKGYKDKDIPMGSAHLKGSAVDILDEDGDLHKWVLANIPILESVGLWCEDLTATPNWVHFQTYPPASGMRFFKP